MSEVNLKELVDTQRVIVCAGAGGVGKTSVSASMALGAARGGKRVLVVTVDPSKRLAEALGVDRNPTDPVPVPQEKLEALGVTPPGSLHAWMLDPQLVADRVVKRFSRTQEDADRLMANRIYKNVTAMVAGMQEYTAVEALHGFVADDSYDLIILDTPPSRNALHFLDAPERAGRFLDKRIFNLFVPGEGSLIRRAATKLIERVMDAALGNETREDLQTFFTLFSSILARLHRNADEMRAFFTRPDVSVLVVTSPAREALDEALYLASRTRDDLSMPLAGYILNRSLAQTGEWELPDSLMSDENLDDSTRAGLEKLKPIAAREHAEAERHRALLVELANRLGGEGVALGLPLLARGIDDLTSLSVLAEALVGVEA
jgi:anion-transporting  ArsA/GET3 family ATPase